MKKKKQSLFVNVFVGVFLLLISAGVSAQAIAENVLDDVIISKSEFTGIIKVLFKIPVRYISHSPRKAGKEVRIKVDLLSKVSKSITNEEFGLRESVVPQYKDSFGLEEVLYETVGRDNYVTLFFDKDVSFEIITDPSYRSLSIILHNVK